MDKLKKAKSARLIYILIGAFLAIAGAVTFSFVEQFKNAHEYKLLVIFFAISAICIYVAVFMFFAAVDRTVAVRLIPVAEELGIDSVDAIAEHFCWSKKATAKYIAKCKKWRYL